MGHRLNLTWERENGLFGDEGGKALGDFGEDSTQLGSVRGVPVFALAGIGDLDHPGLVGLVGKRHREDHDALSAGRLGGSDWIGARVVDAVGQDDKHFDGTIAALGAGGQRLDAGIDTPADIGAAGTERLGVDVHSGVD